jgi:hypothetical protein
MRLFFFRISAFTFILFSFIGILYLSSDLFLNYRKQYFLNLEDNITIAFLGDSHVANGVNDSLIPNSINLAEQGEAYLYSYAKLKAILKYNKQIRTIFLGFSFDNSLKKSRDDEWLFSDKYVLERNSKYNYLLGNQEKALIFTRNPKSYSKGIPDCVISNFRSIWKSYYTNSIFDFGGYKYSDRDKLKENIKLNDSAQNSHDKFEVGEYQVKYLALISDLCKQNHVKLILLNMPLHGILTKETNFNKHNYGILIEELLDKDSLLDLSKMHLHDSCFGDLAHLNYKGANIFSKFLKEKLTLKN